MGTSWRAPRTSASAEHRCKSCRRNLYPPTGAKGVTELRCPRCKARTTVELPAESSQ